MQKHKPTQEQADALSITRVRMLQKPENAFFATIVLNTPTHWTTSIDTAATNGIDLFINPDFFMNLSKEERMFLLVHECMHVVYEHAGRLGNRNQRLWNVAADYCINVDLVARGYVMPKGGLLDKRFKDMSSDQIYEILRDENNDEQPQYDDLQPQAGSGDSEDGEGEGNGQSQAPTPEQVAEHVKNLTTQAVQSSQMAKEAGGVPGDIERMLDNLLNPKLPWDKILSRFLYSLAKTDYSWARPNRRFLHQGIILPSLHGESIGQIDFAIDTSGSVSQSDFNRFISEIAYVFTRFKPTGVGVYQFDHILQTTDKVASIAEFKKLKFTGGGGTDIQPVLTYFKEKSQAKALIVLTDGYFYHSADMDPKRPVVWLIYDNPNWKPPFGTAVYFDN